jgi:VWFA-related protein
MRTPLIRWMSAVLITLVSVPQMLPAEETEVPPAVEFTDEVNVTIANIDVYVRDREGNPVTGLGRDDFVLTMNGVRQEISHFAALTEEVIESRLEPGVPGAVPAPASEDFGDGREVSEVIRPTWVVLYIDNENLHPIDRTRVVRRVREFVAENLKPPVQMMVVAYQGSLKVIQDFTDDPRAVNQSLRSLSKYSGGWISRESARAELVNEMREVVSSDHGRDTETRGKKERMYQQIMGLAREEADSLSRSLVALRHTIETLSGLHGRKALIYVSNGLPMTPGLGLMHEYAAVFHDNTIMAARSRFDQQRQYRSLTSLASGQEVIIHTLSAEGLDVSFGGDASSAYGVDPTASQVGASNFLGSMRFMANQTGGIAIVNTNDPTEGLIKIRDDLFTFYSLGFRVGTTHEDRIHKIQVELPGVRGVDVRYRKRFVEKSLETRIQDRVMTALVIDLDDNPMNLRVTRGATAPATDERWTVPVEISVPYEELTMVPEGDDLVAHLVLYVGARSSDGRQSDVQRQIHEVRAPAAARDSWQDGRFTITAQFLMKEGSHQVVVGLLDSLPRQASYATVNLSVP